MAALRPLRANAAQRRGRGRATGQRAAARRGGCAWHAVRRVRLCVPLQRGRPAPAVLAPPPSFTCWEQLYSWRMACGSTWRGAEVLMRAARDGKARRVWLLLAVGVHATRLAARAEVPKAHRALIVGAAAEAQRARATRAEADAAEARLAALRAGGAAPRSRRLLVHGRRRQGGRLCPSPPAAWCGLCDPSGIQWHLNF
jgi:hypothetical protein